MGAKCGCMTNPKSNEELAEEEISDHMKISRKQDEGVKKLLLLGAGSSGKSTLFKQIKLIHGWYFEDRECREAAHVIRQNCVLGIIKLLKKSQELYERNPELNGACRVDLDNTNLGKTIQSIVDWYLEVGNQVFEANKSIDWSQLKELGECLEHIWALKEIQETFARRDQFSLPDNMDYFLNKVHDIMEEKYVPDDEDCLRVRIRTTGVVKEEYQFQQSTFQIYDAGGQRAERKKWIHQFADVTAIIFVAALNHYASVLFEDEQKNSMQESIELFDEICNSKWFRATEKILFLNKDDLFRLRLKDGIPLSVCFSEEAGWNGSMWQGQDYEEKGDATVNEDYFEECYKQALEFINQQYLSQNHTKTKIFVHVTTATDRDNVQTVFWDVQNIVVRSNMKATGLVF